MPVTATPGLQHPQEAFSVDPIGFDAARPAVDLDAGRIHHPAGDSALSETALQPEPVIARLEDAFDLDGSPQSGFGAVPDLLDVSMSVSASPPPTRRCDTLPGTGSWIARSHVVLLSSIATRAAATPKS